MDLYAPILSPAELHPFYLDSDGLHLLDQRALPQAERWSVLRDVEEVATAIETLAVRGAPAIGGAAALGMALVARAHANAPDAAFVATLRAADARLRRTRPTAKNLFFALDACSAAAEGPGNAHTRALAVVAAAERVVRDDVAACAAIAKHGAALLHDGDVILTVCHTGALATCGVGTALGAVKQAHRDGKRVQVLALETRPLLQGARLTAWECLREGIPCTLLTDGMAAFAFARRGVTRAIAGADRITRDGSVANKIGTYGLAVLAHAHGVPFIVAAPSSTFDLSLATGSDIVIEERAPNEVRTLQGVATSPADVAVWNPAFDVTPPRYVAHWVTEHGLFVPAPQ